MNDPYGLDASELPPELIAQLSGARTQRAIAEAMLKQSMSPLEVQQPKGRFQGVVSPLEAIAKLTQGALARGDMAASDRVAETVARQQTQNRDKAMADYLRTKNGVPGTAPLTPNDDEGNPMPSVGGVKGDPRAAIAQALMNKAMPREFLKWEQSALDKADNREDQQAFLKEQQAARLIQQKADLEARLADKALSREQQAILAKQHDETLRAIKQMGIDSRQPVAPTVTDIVRPDGRVVKIDAKSGREIGISPQDNKLQGAFNQDKATLDSTSSELDRLALTANQLKNHEGLPGIVAVQGKLPNFPGGKSADADALLETLKSQVGFGVLQAMRNASKTGGALGNVSDAEGKRLEANLAALNKAQSLEQFKKQLDQILTFTEASKDRLREAFNMKHSKQGGGAPAGGGNVFDAADAIIGK